MHNLFKQYILGVFWSALQLYLEHRVGFLNTVFDLFDFFQFLLSIFGYDQQNSFIHM
jgi:hypothetical protein